MNSHHEYIREVFDFMPRQSAEDWQNVRARLIAVPERSTGCGQVSTTPRTGQVAARRQALACAAQCDVWVAPTAASPSSATKCESLDLSVEARNAAAAYTEFARWLRTEYAAVARLMTPSGGERYRLMARYHNGTDLDVDETYLWGWSELHGIESRVAELVEQISHGPRGTNASLNSRPIRIA
jgi:uncharacterized protein (DUF885 family)